METQSTTSHEEIDDDGGVIAALFIGGLLALGAYALHLAAAHDAEWRVNTKRNNPTHRVISENSSWPSFLDLLNDVDSYHTDRVVKSWLIKTRRNGLQIRISGLTILLGYIGLRADRRDVVEYAYHCDCIADPENWEGLRSSVGTFSTGWLSDLFAK